MTRFATTLTDPSQADLLYQNITTASSISNMLDRSTNMLLLVFMPFLVVEIVPPRVVEMVPVAVVDIVPVRVVEIVPALVVEIVPDFEKALIDKNKINIPEQIEVLVLMVSLLLMINIGPAQWIAC